MPEILIPPDASGKRLDAWLSAAQPEFSRSRWQALIRSGRLMVNGRVVKPNHTLNEGDRAAYTLPPPQPVDLEPEAIDLDILYEDADLIAINKPPGLVVHPAAGHPTGTLVHALLHHCPDLKGIGGELRPGIVHRLDKDTSGVLVAAKHEAALRALQTAFKSRLVYKEYRALVRGKPAPPRGTVETLIGRHPQHRKKMSATPAQGRHAVTHYRTLETWSGASLLAVIIETGRTHQIRVHLAHLGHPVLGDTLYGTRSGRNLPPVERQMLHAWQLRCPHPGTGEELTFTAPLPGDMRGCLAALSDGATPDPEAYCPGDDRQP